MTNEQGIVKVQRMRDLGRQLQQIALDLANEGEAAISQVVLRAALKSLSYKLPKGAVEGGES